VTRPHLRFDHKPAVINGEPDLGTNRQVQNIEQCAWKGQHDRAADFAQSGCVHGHRLESYVRTTLGALPFHASWVAQSKLSNNPPIEARNRERVSDSISRGTSRCFADLGGVNHAGMGMDAERAA